MSISRGILKWADKKQEEAITEIENGKVAKGMAKASLSGMAEGFVDGCVIWYPVLVGALGYVAYKNKQK